MYTFVDNWYRNHYEFASLREAKKEAAKVTYGFCIPIYKKGTIVAVVQPKENPLP